MRTSTFRYQRYGRRRFLGGMGLLGMATMLRSFARSLVIDPKITENPGVALGGDNVRVDGTGFDPRVKFALTTFDRDGLEVGITSNTNRPARDGSFHCGIKVPPKMPCLIQAYQGAKVVACVPVQVKR